MASTTMRKKFIQISTVAKVVVKEALAQPISAWPCIRDLNLPPKTRSLLFSVKNIRMPPLVLFIISMNWRAVTNLSIIEI